MQYCVYDNGKPARYPDCKVDDSWDNNVFFTFDEAFAYARNWLGEWDMLPSDWNGSSLDYSGAGDTIEIRLFP